MKTSNGGRCVFCSIPALAKALESRNGKRNIVMQLKHWREAGSPTYDFALAHSSLVVLDPAQLLRLRYRAGERTKFDVKNSWLHKKTKRLTHFVLGRPAARTPRLSHSTEAEAFVKHCRYYGQRNVPCSYPKNNEWIELVGKDVIKINDYGKETMPKKRWKGRCLWSTNHTMRAHRQAWWRAYRRIRRLLRDSLSRGLPPYEPLLTWALENKVTSPARWSRKRKREKPLDEPRHGGVLECASDSASSSSQEQARPHDLLADPVRQALADEVESPKSRSALPLSATEMMLWAQMHRLLVF